MFIVRNDAGYLCGYDEDETDEDGVALVFCDAAAEALVIEHEAVALVAAAFVGGEVEEIAQA